MAICFSSKREYQLIFYIKSQMGESIGRHDEYRTDASPIGQQTLDVWIGIHNLFDIHFRFKFKIFKKNRTKIEFLVIGQLLKNSIGEKNWSHLSSCFEFSRLNFSFIISFYFLSGTLSVNRFVSRQGHITGLDVVANVGLFFAYGSVFESRRLTLFLSYIISSHMLTCSE